MRRASVPLPARAPTCPRSAGSFAAARAAAKARGGGLRPGTGVAKPRGARCARAFPDWMMRCRPRAAGNGECVVSGACAGSVALATVGVSQTVAPRGRLPPAGKKRGHLRDSKVGACHTLHARDARRRACRTGRGSASLSATQPPFDPWSPRVGSARLPAGPSAARCRPSRRCGHQPCRLKFGGGGG